MNNYQQFSLMDFIQDADFIRWVREKRPADQQFWEEWLSQHPDKAPLIEEARHVLDSIDIIPPKIIPRELIQLETQKLLQAIGASLPHQALEAESPLPSARTLRLFKLKLAAAALILTAAALLYLFRPQIANPKKFAYSSLVSSRHLIEKINTSSSKADSILFADGSLIRLGPNSRISYPAGFDTAATREVYLSGEAFFHIAKNPHHSFRVIAGEVSVYSQAIPAEQAAPQAGLTADLKGETFYHKLDLICRAIGAKYEVIDGQVVISFSNNKPNLIK